MTDTTAGPIAIGVAIVGGGLMGAGIAAHLAAGGQRVRVCEANPAAARGVADRCAAVFAELVAGGVLDDAGAEAARGRIEVTSDVVAFADAAFVIEAVSESLAAKHAVYAALEGVLGPDAILASSTSGFTPEQLAANLSRPERFLVAHFWNPPHLVPLVEVVPGPRTAPSVVDATLARLTACGCTPVRLQRAVPGFVGNRLQFALLREAIHLLEAGVADAETIDRIVTASIGRRYAEIDPLAGADVGGLATFGAIAAYLLPELADGDAAARTLAGLAAAGRLGRSSGRGFHAWTPAREAALRQGRERLLATRAPRPGAAASPSAELRGTARIRIHDGQLEAFKRLAAQCVALVRAQDTGTLEYRLSLNADGTECIVHERYRDSEAGLAHMARIAPLAEAMSRVCTVQGEVCGHPSPALRQALEAAGVRIYTPLGDGVEVDGAPGSTGHGT